MCDETAEPIQLTTTIDSKLLRHAFGICNVMTAMQWFVRKKVQLNSNVARHSCMYEEHANEQANDWVNQQRTRMISWFLRISHITSGQKVHTRICFLSPHIH